MADAANCESSVAYHVSLVFAPIPELNLLISDILLCLMIWSGVVQEDVLWTQRRPAKDVEQPGEATRVVADSVSQFNANASTSIAMDDKSHLSLCVAVHMSIFTHWQRAPLA